MGSSMIDVTVLGGRGYRWFCDGSTKALLLKWVTMGEGVSNLWMTPIEKKEWQYRPVFWKYITKLIDTIKMLLYFESSGALSLSLSHSVCVCVCFFLCVNILQMAQKKLLKRTWIPN